MKLKSLVYSLLIAALTSTAYAQVKIGANPGTITSTSNLEVESSNGTKVVVDKTTGNLGAGVTDPGQSIDGAGTARLRNIPTSTTNNLILTVDANGVIAKQTAQVSQLPTISGSLSATGVSIAANETGYLYTGSTITLPANSKYLVSVTMLLNPNSQFPTGSATWVRSTFFDSPTSTQGSSDIISGVLVSGLLPANSAFSLMTGTIQIVNTSSSPKTYYYKVGNTTPTGNVAGITLALLGASRGENQMYAVPIN